MGQYLVLEHTAILVPRPYARHKGTIGEERRGEERAGHAESPVPLPVPSTRRGGKATGRLLRVPAGRGETRLQCKRQYPTIGHSGAVAAVSARVTRVLSGCERYVRSPGIPREKPCVNP